MALAAAWIAIAIAIGGASLDGSRAVDPAPGRTTSGDAAQR
jgi:hypothetical protein